MLILFSYLVLIPNSGYKYALELSSYYFDSSLNISLRSLTVGFPKGGWGQLRMSYLR